MLGPGSIEWGSKRSGLEKFDYAVGDLALCHRHEGEWRGVRTIRSSNRDAGNLAGIVTWRKQR
jgi:hypothetical protein